MKLNPFARTETTEERHQRTTIAPQQEALAAETAARVEQSTRRGWRDRGTPEEQARIGYGPNHPMHPSNRHT